MNEAKQVKARAKALRAEKAALQAKLAEARGRETGAIRLKLAAVEEDLVDCARLLRELMPRHKISRGKTWSGLEGWQWDKLQYQTWAELEGAESPEGPTEQDKMRLAVRAARTGLTPAQEAYLAQTDVGKRPAQVAREAGKHRSTVCRTLRRGKDRIAEDAKVLYDLLGRREGGPLVIDLGEPEVLKAVLDRLTQRQQTYLYLYYGEWLSLREIGALLGVDHASVLRSIRCGLRRIEGDRRPAGGGSRLSAPVYPVRSATDGESGPGGAGGGAGAGQPGGAAHGSLQRSAFGGGATGETDLSETG